MRLGLAFVLVTALGACGSDSGGGGGGGGDDDGTDPGDGDNGGGDLEPPAHGFQLKTPVIDIPAGREVTYCWYFRTPNTQAMAIKRWQSRMTPGSHHMIMYTTGNTDVNKPGEVTTNRCGTGGNPLSFPVWTYATQNEEADLVLPADDGSLDHRPLGQEIPPNTAGFFQMHYLNVKDVPIKVRVTLNAEAHEANVSFTPTAAYVTYNPNIDIPRDAVGHVESETCSTPAGAKFWLMSTHAHKQAVKTEVLDGTGMVFSSTDWAHPGVARFDPGFRTFSTNSLTYRCTYNNTGDNHSMVVEDGDSAAINEMCMASGYYFPASGPKFCYGDFVMN